jgi:hypothetical protein
MQAFLLLNQTWGHFRILSPKSEYCLVMMEETQVILSVLFSESANNSSFQDI